MEKPIINEYYINKLDLSLLQKYITENGELKIYNKKEYLIRQFERKEYLGFISEGIFRYTRMDSSGNEHIVGYSPTHHFVGDYAACLCHCESLVNIQAVKSSKVYIIQYEKLERLFNSSAEYQHLGRIVAEQLFVMTYRRVIDSYCCTPEERYRDFIHYYPELKEILPLKEIASFIGVTPETISHIRRKIRNS